MEQFRWDSRTKRGSPRPSTAPYGPQKRAGHRGCLMLVCHCRYRARWWWVRSSHGKPQPSLSGLQLSQEPSSPRPLLCTVYVYTSLCSLSGCSFSGFVYRCVFLGPSWAWPHGCDHVSMCLQHVYTLRLTGYYCTISTVHIGHSCKGDGIAVRGACRRLPADACLQCAPAQH